MTRQSDRAERTVIVTQDMIRIAEQHDPRLMLRILRFVHERGECGCSATMRRYALFREGWHHPALIHVTGKRGGFTWYTMGSDQRFRPIPEPCSSCRREAKELTWRVLGVVCGQYEDWHTA